MDANQMFSNLISDIETSGLNYLVSKTPFSANISLKNSFAEHFHQEIHQTNSKKREAPDNNDYEDRKQELESLKLREKVASLEKLLVDQKAIIDERWEAEKKLKTSNEKKVTDFRADLLKVKGEKSKLSSALKAAETEMEKSRQTQQTLLIENDDLKCKLNVINDLMNSKDSEITAAAKENTKLKHEIHNLQGEVTTVLANHERDIEKAQKTFQCHLCDQYVEGQLKMRLHVGEKHCCDCESQTDLDFDKNYAKFKEFICFYCEILLKAGEDLELHKSWCQPIPLTDYPCKKCGAQCIDEKELETHMNSYHKKDSYQEVRDHSKDEDLNTCDFCGIKFETLGGLQNHIRSLHKEMLPG
jgi:hypothetical protein